MAIKRKVKTTPAKKAAPRKAKAVGIKKKATATASSVKKVAKKVVKKAVNKVIVKKKAPKKTAKA